MRYNGFTTKYMYFQKGDESSWQNYTRQAVRSAITKQTFINMEKIRTDIRNTNVGNVAFNGR